MKYLWGTLLGLILAGCTPQEMTEEEELARARAEKAKHPEQWHKPRKLTQTEATQQQREWLEIESEHLARRKAIHAKHRCG